MNNKKISVIIPIFNTSSYLRKCLDSILGQEWEDIEIICINDGSTDSSLCILEEYASRNNCIRIFNQVNKGQSYSRNVGIKNAIGDYIFFLDSDDFCLLGIFKEFLVAIENNPEIIMFNGIGYCNNRFVLYSDFKNEYDSKKLTGKEVLLQNKYPLTVWSFLYRRDFLITNNILFKENVSHEDLPFVIFALFFSSNLQFIPYLTPVIYRNNISSITNVCSFKSLDDLMLNCVDLYFFFRKNKFLNNSTLNRIYTLFKYAVNHAIDNNYIVQFDKVFTDNYASTMDACAQTTFEKKEVVLLEKGLDNYIHFLRYNERLSAVKYCIKKLLNKD